MKRHKGLTVKQDGSIIKVIFNLNHLAKSGGTKTTKRTSNARRTNGGSK